MGLNKSTETAEEPPPVGLRVPRHAAPAPSWARGPSVLQKGAGPRAHLGTAGWQPLTLDLPSFQQGAEWGMGVLRFTEGVGKRQEARGPGLRCGCSLELKAPGLPALGRRGQRTGARHTKSFPGSSVPLKWSTASKLWLGWPRELRDPQPQPCPCSEAQVPFHRAPVAPNVSPAEDAHPVPQLGDRPIPPTVGLRVPGAE